MRYLILGILGTTALSTGCAVDGDPTCMGGKCDSNGDFASKLDGRNDPIAKFLRQAGVDKNGKVKADYGDIAKGVASLQGCAESSWRTYVVSDPLVEGAAFPRLVSSVCASDPNKASEFFIAASFKDPDENDIDPRNLEMFAWDTTAGVYRFYAANAEGPGDIQVDIEPERCRGCHLTPNDLAPDGMRMTPIMNELTQPWSHWNSQIPMFNAQLNPFPSHDFDVPEDVRGAGDFTRYGKDLVGSASDLEQIIRAGHSRVTGERVKERRNTAPDWKPAMNLLRPMFCEEQIQYATEDFETGLVSVSAVVPGGIREAYRAIRADNWPWDWMNNQDGRMRMQPPASVPAVAMIPIRGNVDVDFENRLLGVRALTPMQVLRVRALDWKRPVLSEFRCGLWKSATARFQSSPPMLNLAGRIGDHMKVLFELILTIDGTPIKTASETTFIALSWADSGSAAALAGAVKGGTLPASCSGTDGMCSVDIDTFGLILSQHVSSFETGPADTVRNQLLQMRAERLCKVKKNFENAPHLPPVSCP